MLLLTSATHAQLELLDDNLHERLGRDECKPEKVMMQGSDKHMLTVYIADHALCVCW